MTGHNAAPGVARLTELFHGGEWPTERVWLRRHADRNPFMTANILLILTRCGGVESLAARMREARSALAAYREGHVAYHWPVEDGRSRMANAPMFWRHRLVEISPDADCTCLVQMANRDPSLDDAIVDELAFYRADGERFSLPGFQLRLPAALGSFLTWFPPRESCHSGKLETIDVGADANILWYLASIGRLDAPGAAQTIGFVAEVVHRQLALREPFRVSMYYPQPAVLLYLITRAALWGEIDALVALRPQLLEQLAICPVRSSIEQLCRAAALALWKEHPGFLPIPDGRGAFYVGPLLAWPLQRFAPLERLAAHPATHIGFCSEALEWALHAYI